MRRPPLLAALLLLTPYMAIAADAPKLADKQTYPLWVGKAPGQRDVNPADPKDKAENHFPAVQVFLPEKPTGASIVVCPGGGYGGLANHEGPVVGEWLAKNGVTAFVLRYRLGSKGYHHPIEMGDASRAVRFVRTYAKDWNLDPARIGILGFSAGGHLASTVSTHYDAGDASAADPIDRASSRPDLSVLIYPVITMGPTGHAGSRNNLLGKDKANDPALIELLSNEKHVNDKTPPAFLVHGIDDKAVPVSNSDSYAEALKKAGVDVEYVRVDKGPHGFGLKDFWTDKCVAWLRKHKF
ncbi:MAG: alpha/beta hydrolase [Phycisphaerae bacterium]